jgi:uncharacterized protein
MNASAPRPLSDPEIARLDTLLGEIDPDHSMAVEEFDGFCAALACCPEPISREEWLPMVLGESARAVGALKGQGADAALLKLIDRHRESVVADLSGGEGFAPVLSQDEHGTTWGHAWAIGFARGMALRPEAWDDLETDEEIADALDPLMRLVNEAQGEQPDASGGAPDDAVANASVSKDAAAEDAFIDDLESDWPPIADDERPTVIHDMLDGVQDVFAYFAPARRKALAPRPVRRDASTQAGRNEPCPCGSGKKFKHCHGKD